MSPLSIAIITPSFNQGEFIEETILSILSQNFERMTYIVVDGASTDNTLEILHRYENQLTYVSERDQGQTDAVNKGIKATKSDIIGWLNSDDIYYPDILQKVVDYFSANPEVDIIYGKANHIDRIGQYIDAYPTQDYDPKRLLETCFISQPAVFFRRTVIERCGLLDQSLVYCMDYEYWLRLSLDAGIKFAYLPELLAATRLYADTKTLGAKVKVHTEINNMLKKKLGYVPESWLYNYAHARIENQCDRKKQPYKFILGVSLLSCYASLRWNHKISIATMKLLGQWLFGLLSKRRGGLANENRF